MWWLIGTAWIVAAVAMIALAGMSDPMGKTDRRLFWYLPILPLVLIWIGGYLAYGVIESIFRRKRR
jgi:hypothetical protein